MGIPMLKIRRPVGRLIFNMGIAIPSKTVFLIETAPSKRPLPLPLSYTFPLLFESIFQNFFKHFIVNNPTRALKWNDIAMIMIDIVIKYKLYIYFHLGDHDVHIWHW